MNIWNIYYKLQHAVLHSLYYIYYLLSKIPIPQLDLVQIYIIVTFSIVAVFLYIKLRYPFWNVQPVYHTYDFWRKLYKTPFQIQRYYPLKTRFYKNDNVKTISYTDIKPEEFSTCIDLLQTSYISSDKVLFTITENILQKWLSGTDGTPLLSFYNDKTYEINENSEIITKYIPIGCMFSKPIYLYFINKEKINIYNQISCYYWDYICIRREHISKNYSRNLIQTHEYNQRMKFPTTAVSLFKKEINLCQGIVPWVQFNTYTYHLRNIHIEPLPPHFVSIQILHENKDILMNFLSGLSSPNIPKIFEIICTSSVSNLIEMTQSFQLYIYCLKYGEHIYGMYFFKDENVLYEDIDNGNTLHLIGSINNSTSFDIFYTGYMYAIRDIIKQNKKRKHFQMIMIDDNSHNSFILQRWNQKFSTILETPIAYYLYNYFYPGSPISSEKTFILL